MSDGEDFNQVVEIMRRMAARFQKIEGRPWGAEGAIIELSKQVGELSALAMSREGYYFDDRSNMDGTKKYVATDEAIADEVYDCMFALLRVADHYGINILAAAKKADADNDAWFAAKGVDFAKL